MPGRNHLYIPGPTNMPERVRAAIDVPLEDHRAPDVPEFLLPLYRDLKKVLRTDSGEVLVFTASGTGGWEAAVCNTLSPGDRVLIACFGQFSDLWAQLCRQHGLEVSAIERPWGEGVPLEQFAAELEADRGHAIRAVLVTHNETATGVTSDVAAVRRILDDLDHPALLMVDGISSIAAIDFRMDEWGVDVAIAGSQKGFMLPTGLAILGVSRKALAAGTEARLPRGYFDFQAMLAANAQGYWPYTTPMPLMRGLRAAVDMLLEEGLDAVAARHHRAGEAVRRAVRAWGLELCAAQPRWYSDTVTAVVVPQGHDARQVLDIAYRRYDLSLGAGLSKVAGRVFRIGHIGDFNELMILTAVTGAEMAMRDAGIMVEPGSGVAAAAEHFRATASDAGGEA